MSEKRKPYATLTIRKPRMSFLLLVILVLAIVAVAVSGFVQERNEQAAELSALLDSVEKAQASLQQSQAELSAAEAKLVDYRAPFADPLAYYDYLDGRGKWLRLYACSQIVFDSFMSEESGVNLLSFNVLARKITRDMTQRDNYALVGEYDWAAPGESTKTIFFYMRQDVLDERAFVWPDSTDWAVQHRNWEEYLDEHCLGK